MTKKNIKRYKPEKNLQSENRDARDQAEPALRRVMNAYSRAFKLRMDGKESGLRYPALEVSKSLEETKDDVDLCGKLPNLDQSFKISNCFDVSGMGACEIEIHLARTAGANHLFCASAVDSGPLLASVRILDNDLVKIVRDFRGRSHYVATVMMDHIKQHGPSANSAKALLAAKALLGLIHAYSPAIATSRVQFARLESGDFTRKMNVLKKQMEDLGSKAPTQRDWLDDGKTGSVLCDTVANTDPSSKPKHGKWCFDPDVNSSDSYRRCPIQIRFERTKGGDHLFCVHSSPQPPLKLLLASVRIPDSDISDPYLPSFEIHQYNMEEEVIPLASATYALYQSIRAYSSKKDGIYEEHVGDNSEE